MLSLMEKELDIKSFYKLLKLRINKQPDFLDFFMEVVFLALSIEEAFQKVPEAALVKLDQRVRNALPCLGLFELLLEGKLRHASFYPVMIKYLQRITKRFILLNEDDDDKASALNLLLAEEVAS